MAQEFKTLFSPIKIGPLTVRNRIFSSPHYPMGYPERLTGLPGDRLINYWVAKAKGGIGLIGTYLTSVDPRRNIFRQPGAVEAFKQAADAVHEYGAGLICQIAHSGGQEGLAGGMEVAWSPSSMLMPNMLLERRISHEMTRDEIKQTVEAYTYAATVAKEAGADGVGIHGSHGYLISEFMSPFFNRRTDEYGGSLENRMRFPLEVISAVRDAVGEDFVVGLRVNSEEFVEGSYSLDDFLKMAPLLTREGKLDYLNISVGTYTSTATVIDPMYFPLSSFVYAAAATKQVVDIPVFARGRITDPVQAEQILSSGQADMVSMVRAFIADPEFANKSQEGRVDEIRRCIGCNEGCWARGTRDLVIGMSVGMTCTMNPTVGLEGIPGWGELIPASYKKRVMVIGGGPAGLEAARVAALRGHKVSLYERGSELGGLTLVAAKAPGRDGFLDLGRYYTYQMKLLDIDVHLESEVTVDTVLQHNPDAVVIATGSAPHIPDIPGIDSENVCETRQILRGDVAAGDTIVIIGGDEHIQALSTADFLADLGKRVEVISQEYHCGATLEPCTKQILYQRLFSKGVVLTPHTWVREISRDSVLTYNIFTGEERRISGVDTVVIACGGQEDNALYHALKDRVKEIHLAGDAHGIRRVHDATREGATVGRLL
jgi:2,4-dienoyl-CoA reductase-like NADH-dependent reductase (Old Yellow Enzyme family)/thioredoxin reductase